MKNGHINFQGKRLFINIPIPWVASGFLFKIYTYTWSPENPQKVPPARVVGKYLSCNQR